MTPAQQITVGYGYWLRCRLGGVEVTLPQVLPLDPTATYPVFVATSQGESPEE